MEALPALERREAADGTKFLRALARALGFSGPLPTPLPTQSLALEAALLGTHQSRSGGPYGGFSSKPPGPWLLVKLFFNPDEGIGEFTQKDEEYATVVVAELARVLLRSQHFAQPGVQADAPKAARRRTRVSLGGTRIAPGIPSPLKTHICAPHPTALYSQDTTALLTSISGAPVVAIGPAGDSTTLEHIAALMDLQRESLGLDSWVIWGMSGGSFLAQLYARLHPSRVQGLILASSGPYFRATVEDPECILCPRNKLWSSRLSAEGLLNDRSDGGPTAWELVDGVGWVFRRSGGAALLVSPDTPGPELKRIMPALWAFDSRSWLPQITQPALVMCGTADPIVPFRHAEALAARLPNGRLVAVRDAGHIPLTDQRLVVEGAIRAFLAELT